MASTLAYDSLLSGGKDISRRVFIKRVGAAAACGTLLIIGGQLLASGRLNQVSGWALQRATFDELLGAEFQIYQGSAALLGLRLADVRDLPAAAYKGARGPAVEQQKRSFSLLFSGPVDLTIEQGTYRFEHVRLGSFP